MNQIQEINDICKEVLVILAFFENDVIKKIPNKILIELNNLAAESQIECYIDQEKDLLNQNISERSKDLIALLYYSYIANESEKNKILQKWETNEIEYYKELDKKYNSKSMFFKVTEFNNTNKKNDIKNNTSMELIEHKKTYWTKFKNFIFKLLYKNKNL